MAKKFELGNALADVLGGVPKTDTAAEQIVMLPLASIDGDAKNFYSVEGIDALAANIELVGLMDPLRVRENPDMPGRYLIVSGHRRRAALWTLFEENPEKWGKAPCIVEPPAESPEMQELRLIYANADTRVLSDADQSAQAERVEMLLYKLSEQGVSFPGRMRAHVAEACKTSSTKIAEWKAIREKLIPYFRELWETGRLNHTKAYQIAQQAADLQEQFADDCDRSRTDVCGSPEWAVRQWFEDRKRRNQAQEKKTGNEPAFDADAYGAELEREQAMLRMAIRQSWMEQLCGNIARGRLPDNRLDAIETLKKCYRNAGFVGPHLWGYDGKPNGLQIETPDGHTRFLAHYTDVFDQLALLAIQELYRRFEMDRAKPKTAPAISDVQRLISVDDRYPAEGQYVIAYTRALVAIPSVYFRAAFMDCTEKSVANNRLTGIEYWSPRPQLPEGKIWPGQEIIEGMVSRK